jgi:hypothetical protein
MTFGILLHRPSYIDFPTWMLFANTFSVAFTGWIAVPWISRVYQQWLEGKGTKNQEAIALATIVIILLGIVQVFRIFLIN